MGGLGRSARIGLEHRASKLRTSITLERAPLVDPRTPPSRPEIVLVVAGARAEVVVADVVEADVAA